MDLLTVRTPPQLFEKCTDMTISLGQLLSNWKSTIFPVTQLMDLLTRRLSSLHASGSLSGQTNTNLNILAETKR
jgi:hypothetical protein